MTNEALLPDEAIAIFIGLGSNLGDRAANLHEALERIGALGLEIKRESSLYETEPVGFRDQPWFLNQVVEIGSRHTQYKTPEALLSELLQIEDNMGRERVIVNGPRVIDIDLLLFGDAIITLPRTVGGRLYRGATGTVVPHPRMHLRRFVLEPLCEIAPDIVHPVLKKTCSELLASLRDESQVRLVREEPSTLELK